MLEEDTPQRRQVFVHVTFMKLDEISTIQEKFTAKVVITSRWARDPALDARHSRSDQFQADSERGSADDLTSAWNPNLFIINALAVQESYSELEVERNDDGSTFVVEKKTVEGTFSETMELNAFPFDIQELSVLIRTDHPISEVEVIEDPTRLHTVHTESFADAQEFELYKHVVTSFPYLSEKHRPNDPNMPRISKSDRPSMRVTCFVARGAKYFVWNMFFILFLLCCLTIMTFTLAIKDELLNRLQLLLIVVMTTVMLKSSFNTHLPVIPYLTYVDIYTLFTLILSVITTFWNGIATQLDRENVDFHDMIVMLIMLACWIIFTVILTAFIFSKEGTKRLRMKKLSAQYVKKEDEERERQLL